MNKLNQSLYNQVVVEIDTLFTLSGRNEVVSGIKFFLDRVLAEEIETGPSNQETVIYLMELARIVDTGDARSLFDFMDAQVGTKQKLTDKYYFDLSEEIAGFVSLLGCLDHAGRKDSIAALWAVREFTNEVAFVFSDHVFKTA